NGAATQLKLDSDAARQYIDASRELAHLLGRDEHLSLEALVQCPGVIAPKDANDDIEALHPVLSEALETALRQLDAMRCTEGENLARDLHARLDHILAAVRRVEARLPELNAAYAEKLRTR